MSVTAKSLESKLFVQHKRVEPATSRSPNELFRFRFGKNVAEPVGDAVFRLHIDPIESPAPDEVWFTHGTVSTGTDGPFSIAKSEDYLAAHIQVDIGSTTNMKDLTAETYREILRLVGQHDFPNPIRIWNFFPGINSGEGDLETYRQFTAGRTAAFNEFAYNGDALPAGTAIGTDEGTPLTITAVATRDRCKMIENPRQVSAYRYPRQYGPTSPSFSRAVAVTSKTGHRMLMSGTASIVGHQSMHPGDPLRQATEALRNVDELVKNARREVQSQNPAASTLSDGYLRIYVRRPEQVPMIKPTLRDYLNDDSSLVFLRGDICRRELLLEIEAAGSL
jgi:chorismate lyase/3-hydroxybenzoate synthase